MNRIGQFFFRVGTMLRKRKRDAEMGEEMRHHLELRAERNLADGMSREEARYAAQRSFGGVEQLKERCRDQRGLIWLEQISQDIRYAVRQLVKSPSFAVATVLILALGIGANTAIFTVVNALMLRALPVQEPDRLVVVDGRSGSYAMFDLFRTQAKSFSGMFAVGHIEERRMIARDFGAAETEPVKMQEVSGEFFSVLGRPALVGRALSADDDHAGAARPVVVLSQAYWHRRFNEDAAIVGKTVTVNDVAVTIVGVMPPDFFGTDIGQGRTVQMWCPLCLKTQLDDGFEAARLTTYAAGSTWLSVMGRLRPNISIEQARAELETIERHGLSVEGRRVPKQPLRLQPGDRGITYLRAAFRRPLNVLWTIAGVALAVACANVAGLVLARGESRQREFAVRLAMGASRWRLARQLVTESLLLALLGGALGLWVAALGASFLAQVMSGSALDLRLDPGVLSFAAAVALGTGLLCGVIPALRFSTLDLTSAIKDESSQLTGARTQRVNRSLVILQISLSFILLATAQLFVRTLQNLRLHDYGITRDHVIQFALNTDRARTDAAKAELHRQVLAELEVLAGVQSATISQGGLLGHSNTGGGFTIAGQPGEAEPSVETGFYHGARRYFETKGIRLIAGRDFAARDDQSNAPRVAVISESIARKFFANTNPIGRTITCSIGGGRSAEIVGVARDVEHRGPRSPNENAIYLPYFQQPAIWDARIEFVVRTAMDPHALTPSLRAIVRKIDRGADVVQLGTTADLLDGLFQQERAIAQLAGFFSSLALLLSGIGLYGLLTYSVTRRTREIGVRMALGANARDVVQLMLRQGIWLVIVGCVVGATVAIGLGRLIERLLYGVQSNDPMALGGAALLLLSIALLACWLPARRAAKIDPMVALRCD